MKTAKTLQEIIMKAAQEFGLDLNDASVPYWLKDKFGHIIIVRREYRDFLRIGEYTDSEEGEFGGDPEFLVFLKGEDWMPVSFRDHGRDFNQVTLFSAPGNSYISMSSKEQTQIAKKCEAWVNELMKRNDYDGKTGFLIPTWLA